jgi:hypothetical protein
MILPIKPSSDASKCHTLNSLKIFVIGVPLRKVILTATIATALNVEYEFMIYFAPKPSFGETMVPSLSL